MLQFGIQFFPNVGPKTKPAQQYFDECLQLVDLVDELGYDNIRIVEHYFHEYGGYSPNPIVFLAAASQRSKRARLITGALLPAFNHPLKIAGEIGMLDALSNGRLEVGFARAFLPHEFERFGVSLDSSRQRFDEGIEQVRLLLEQTNVSSAGAFHRFTDVTSLPRPTQLDRPPFWVAAYATPESFSNAGAKGHGIMAIPMTGARIRELASLYRSAWSGAGHPGASRIMLAFHMYCAETRQQAFAAAKGPITRYLASLVEAASAWLSHAGSDAYPGYRELIERLSKETFESQVEKGAVWVGDPETLKAQIVGMWEESGGFEHASLQVNFNTLGIEEAKASMRLFASEVMPSVKQTLATREAVQ
jgi:alkanesulfonate monooxygenase SsuD/methylene tetrahydromethanopterin reductase-like flavin-dependent oxidoreductase (luciferase family)